MGYFKTNILHLPPTRDNPGTMVFYRKTSILPAPKCLSKCCASQKYQHFRKTQNPPGLWGLGIPRSALISLIVGALYEDDSLTSHARIPIPKNARQLPCQVCSAGIINVQSWLARFVQIPSPTPIRGRGQQNDVFLGPTWLRLRPGCSDIPLMAVDLVVGRDEWDVFCSFGVRLVYSCLLLLVLFLLIYWLILIYYETAKVFGKWPYYN